MMRFDTEEIKKHKDLLIAPAIIILATFFIWGAVDSMPGNSNENIENSISHVSPFDNLNIIAKAAYVYDARTGEVLYAKNEDERLPLASVTKVMTAIVASDLGSQNSEIVIDEYALSVDGDSGLFSGERWTLKNLLDFSLTSSSNDGMQAIANSLGALKQPGASAEVRGEAFVREMNNKAEEIDMKNTYFFNPTGLDESEIKGGAYGTAKDIALMFEHVLRYYPSLLEATKEERVQVASLDNFMHTAKNTGLNISKIPGIKASKTGFTDIAGGNLVIAFDPELGHSIIVSVLGSTVTERFMDVNKLVEASLKEITQNK